MWKMESVASCNFLQQPNKFSAVREIYVLLEIYVFFNFFKYVTLTVVNTTLRIHSWVNICEIFNRCG